MLSVDKKAGDRDIDIDSKKTEKKRKVDSYSFSSFHSVHMRQTTHYSHKKDFFDYSNMHHSK